MDTFLGRNAKTCRTKVRRARRRGEQKERAGERGARVTESIVEAYWESANSPGFNLTGEPWAPFNIQARARARDALPHRASFCNATGTWNTSKHDMPFSPTPEERRKETKLSGYSILAELSSNLFSSRDIPLPRQWISNFFLPAFLPSFPSFILSSFLSSYKPPLKKKKCKILFYINLNNVTQKFMCDVIIFIILYRHYITSRIISLPYSVFFSHRCVDVRTCSASINSSVRFLCTVYIVIEKKKLASTAATGIWCVTIIMTRMNEGLSRERKVNGRPMLLSGSYAVFPGGIFRFGSDRSND